MFRDKAPQLGRAHDDIVTPYGTGCDTKSSDPFFG
jgi:hypothetical protein